MKDFDPKKPSQGLGDSIAKITHALGLDKVADKVAEMIGEEDCGCERRKDYLNELFPYKDIPVEDYSFTEPTLFEVLNKVVIKEKDSDITYEVGEKILIDLTHKLYPGLRALLNNKSLKKL